MSVPDKDPTYVYFLGPLTLELWKLDSAKRTRYAYRLFDEEWKTAPVFAADDFKMPGWATNEETALDILSYLVLQEGEAESWFFKDYTPDQLRWRTDRGLPLRPSIVAETRRVAAKCPRMAPRKRK